jgi:3-methylcrotonyl-CoA carboxylase alpha subunit
MPAKGTGDATEQSLSSLSNAKLVLEYDDNNEAGGSGGRPVAVHIFDSAGQFRFIIPEPKWRAETGSGSAGSGAGAGSLSAPMPGVVEKLFVNEGHTVTAGDALVVMIAMKMEYVIKAPFGGTVERVNCTVGESVSRGVQLVSITASAE